MKRSISFLSLLLLCLWAMTGCRRSIGVIEAPEHQHPVMRRARACEQAGDLDKAIALYNEVLLQSPAMASAHLQLALIYHDHARDYIEAIHHYRRYLALRPGTEKQAMIAGRIQKAEQLLATQSVRKISANDPSGQVVLMQQIDKLNANLAKSEAEKLRLTETNAVLSRQNVVLNNRIKRLERWVDRLQTSPGEGDSSKRLLRPADGMTAGATASRTYEVREGDSLSRIADFVYGDPTLWPRIRDANSDKVRNGERVRAGDILAIP
jgi:tetratricopeptide (TPR) repeat protein